MLHSGAVINNSSFKIFKYNRLPTFLHKKPRTLQFIVPHGNMEQKST